MGATVNGWIFDRSIYKHLLGAELNSESAASVRAGFYMGMIWSFCYEPTEVVDYVVLGECEQIGPRCTNCPGHGELECLINCEWDEYLDGEACVKCSDDCTEGCIRGDNCSPCFDDTCSNCPMWTDCEECIDNASLVDD